MKFFAYYEDFPSLYRDLLNVCGDIKVVGENEFCTAGNNSFMHQAYSLVIVANIGGMLGDTGSGKFKINSFAEAINDARVQYFPHSSIVVNARFKDGAGRYITRAVSRLSSRSRKQMEKKNEKERLFAQIAEEILAKALPDLFGVRKRDKRVSVEDEPDDLGNEDNARMEAENVETSVMNVGGTQDAIFVSCPYECYVIRRGQVIYEIDPSDPGYNFALEYAGKTLTEEEYDALEEKLSAEKKKLEKTRKRLDLK